MKKFTLIEALVIVAILAILLSMLLPSIQDARREVQIAVSLNNMKQINIATMLYTKENSGRLMPSKGGLAYFWQRPWDDFISIYLGTNLTEEELISGSPEDRIVYMPSTLAGSNYLWLSKVEK